MGDGGWLDGMAAEYRDFLPQAGMFPRLGPDDVERFVKLGQEGRDRFRAGELDRAEAAYRAQCVVFAANPEPYVSLALVAARRGDEKGALDWITKAVVRGFTELPILERAEGWGALARKMEFLALQDAVPVLQEIERKWGGWSDFRAAQAPRDLEAVLRNHSMSGSILEAMAPALGPRLSVLWTRALDRSTAAALEAYVAEKREEPDAVEAARRLMAIYSGGPILRWETVPGEVAGRLAKVSAFALERFTEPELRAGALVCRALAAYSRRGPMGRHTEDVRNAIRNDLETVLAAPSDPVFAAVAIEGWIHTEIEAGNSDRASALYRSFRAAHAAEPEILARVRDALGRTALLIGGLPEIRATALDGTEIGPDTLAGKVVVVDFWATWCRPCVEEFETLRKIAERHGSEVVLVGINLDRGDEIADADLERWVAARGLPGHQIQDGRGWESPLVKEFGVREIPFTVVAAPDGSIVAVSERGRALERAIAGAVGD